MYIPGSTIAEYMPFAFVVAVSGADPPVIRTATDGIGFPYLFWIVPERTTLGLIWISLTESPL